MNYIPPVTATHVVIIWKDDRENPPYFITPSRVVIFKGDRILFKNLTGTEVAIEFLGSCPLDGDDPPISMDTSSEELRTVNVDANDVYKYEAYCGGTERKAAEGTRPVFIGFKK